MTLWGVPALRLAELVQRRQVSCAEVVEAHLDRIAAVDPDLNAFQVVLADGARQEAAALDSRPDLPGLPLAGVPVAVKDNVDVAGAPTRLGSRATPAGPAAADDELVRRLRSAGCVVIGKTAMPELAIWAHTDSALHGATRNPWRRDLTPGGSTGGGAAAVAAGMAPLALASDGGGSIRIPSAMCGVFGLKPSAATVPLPGRVREHWYGLSAIGPIATTVPDAAALLDVLRGAPAAPVAPLPGRLRIAVSTRSPLAGTAAANEFRAAVEADAALLAGEGHEVEAADPPYPLALGLEWSRNWLAGVAEDAAPLATDALEPVTRRMAGLGARLGPDRAAPARWRAAMTTWFDRFDVLLMPAIANRMPAAGWTRRGLVNAYLRHTQAVPFTQAWNLADLPAASVPAGLDRGGLPLSVQIVGPPGAERRLLEVALLLESVRPWPRLAPSPTR